MLSVKGKAREEESITGNARGQTALEYVLVVVLIALAIFIAFRDAGMDKAVGTAAGNVQNQLVAE